MKRRYPIQHLAVGESTTLPWFQDVKGFRKGKPIDRMISSIRQEQAKKGKLFEWKVTDDGLVVLRTA